jgi:NADPH-dependent glutamate synthase beta subunit-like oxidoreductase
MPSVRPAVRLAQEMGARLGGREVLLRTLSQRAETIRRRAESGAMTVEKMKLDEKGFPQPTGEFETLEADSLVLALGQDVDLSLVDHAPEISNEDGVVKVGSDMMTGRPGVFVGGDMAPSDRTVTVAVGHGKKAAHYVDAYLRGVTYAPPKKRGPASFDRLNAWYYEDAPGTVRPTIETIRRVENFEEVVKGLDETDALYEARRCLSCGNCFECDNCYGVCPDNAVIKLGPGNRFKFDYDYCKGCGLCAAECGAIDMVAEAI